MLQENSLVRSSALYREWLKPGALAVAGLGIHGVVGILILIAAFYAIGYVTVGAL